TDGIPASAICTRHAVRVDSPALLISCNLVNHHACRAAAQTTHIDESAIDSGTARAFGHEVEIAIWVRRDVICRRNDNLVANNQRAACHLQRSASCERITSYSLNRTYRQD